MQGNHRIRIKTAGAAASLLLLLLTLKPSAEAVWNHPGVLVVRSQMQLMLGNTQSAVDLAAQAATRHCRSIGAATF